MKILLALCLSLFVSCEGIIGRRLPREIIQVETKTSFQGLSRDKKFDAIIEQYGSLIVIILLDGELEKENLEIARLEFDMQYQYTITRDGHSQFRDIPEIMDAGITLSGTNKTQLLSYQHSKADGHLLIKEDGEEVLTIKYTGTYIH